VAFVDLAVKFQRFWWDSLGPFAFYAFFSGYAVFAYAALREIFLCLLAFVIFPYCGFTFPACSNRPS
jgi:hypothetical protein